MLISWQQLVLFDLQDDEEQVAEEEGEEEEEEQKEGKGGGGVRAGEGEDDKEMQDY